MSFLFGGGRAPPSSAEKIAAAETEVELMTDMYNRLNQSCSKKCIPPEYRESELNRGESICLDRCVAKFFEVTTKVGEKMQNDQGVGAGGGAAGGNYSA